jgi:hypothetical protein
MNAMVMAILRTVNFNQDHDFDSYKKSRRGESLGKELFWCFEKDTFASEDANQTT